MSRTEHRFAVILPTAGKSSRFGTPTEPLQKKPFLPLAGRPVWTYSASLFAARPDVAELLIVLAAEDREFFETKFAAELARLRERLRVALIEGGRERADSVQNAMNALGDDIDMVAVHDTARPCVAPAAVEAVFQAAVRHGAALLASPIVGTIKRSADHGMAVETTVPREHLWEAQTPQVFWRSILHEAYARRAEFFPREIPTDDAQLVERLGRPVILVPSDRSNLKITTPADLLFAKSILDAVADV